MKVVFIRVNDITYCNNVMYRRQGKRPRRHATHEKVKYVLFSALVSIFFLQTVWINVGNVLQRGSIWNGGFGV
jgi:hypothetical protein